MSVCVGEGARLARGDSVGAGARSLASKIFRFSAAEKKYFPKFVEYTSENHIDTSI